jgi:hypothetical protein
MHLTCCVKYYKTNRRRAGGRARLSLHTNVVACVLDTNCKKQKILGWRRRRSTPGGAVNVMSPSRSPVRRRALSEGGVHHTPARRHDVPLRAIEAGGDPKGVEHLSGGQI